MDTVLSWFSTAWHWFRDPTLFVKTIGYVGLNLIIFAETGLFFGFFLPGDSLLLTAGIFAASGIMSLKILLSSLTLMTILGDFCGFHIGKKLGYFLYEKKESFFFRKEHLLHAKNFYDKHGGITIAVARFMPFIRTFAPAVAGASKMEYRRFSLYNISGGFLWVWSLTLAGYFLGKSLGESISHYIHILILGIIGLSLAPLFVRYYKSKNSTPV